MNIPRSTNIDLIFYTQYLIIKSAASQSQCRMNLHQTAIKQSQVPDPPAVLLSDTHPHWPNCTARLIILISILTNTHIKYTSINVLSPEKWKIHSLFY